MDTNAAAGVGHGSRKRLRVLIADDTAAIRDSMSNLISRLADVEIVGQADTGTKALALIRSLKPDVATLDIRMPELSGINVLTALKREGLSETMTVMMLSGLGEMEYRKKCLELGAKYFFHKATEFELVVEVLKEQARVLNAV